MSLSLLHPNLQVDSVVHISVPLLLQLGIKGLIIDIDNTVVEWGKDDLSPEIQAWFQALWAEGIQVCIVSNNSMKRVENLANTLGLPAFCKARKPSRKAYRSAISLMRITINEAAVVGDQIFTDILGGNRLGLYTILVSPMSRREFIGTKAVRILERLFLSHLRKNF